MKIRSDFVTNSSSSSFIIATKQDVPERYADVIKLLTKENALDAIKETSDYEWMPACDSMTEDAFQRLGHFTDEQMVLLKLDSCGELGRYLDVIKSLEAAEASGSPVYHVFVDRDWLYNEPLLSRFIDDSVKIDEKFDL